MKVMISNFCPAEHLILIFIRILPPPRTIWAFQGVSNFSNKYSSTISIRSQHWVWGWKDKKIPGRGGNYYGWCHSSDAWRCKNQSSVLESLMKSRKNWAIIKKLLKYADIRPRSDTTSSSNYWYKSNKPSTTVSFKKKLLEFLVCMRLFIAIDSEISVTGCLFVLCDHFSNASSFKRCNGSYTIFNMRIALSDFFLSLCY